MRDPHGLSPGCFAAGNLVALGTVFHVVEGVVSVMKPGTCSSEGVRSTQLFACLHCWLPDTLTSILFV